MYYQMWSFSFNTMKNLKYPKSESIFKDVNLNKFVIILDHIKLDVSWPVQLIVKWENGILPQNAYSTCKPIQINPKEDQEHEIEEGYKEYEVMMRHTEMKIV